MESPHLRASLWTPKALQATPIRSTGAHLASHWHRQSRAPPAAAQPLPARPDRAALQRLPAGRNWTPLGAFWCRWAPLNGRLLLTKRGRLAATARPDTGRHFRRRVWPRERQFCVSMWMQCVQTQCAVCSVWWRRLPQMMAANKLRALQVSNARPLDAPVPGRLVADWGRRRHSICAPTAPETVPGQSTQCTTVLVQRFGSGELDG